VFPGMSVAEAKALCPTARVLPFEPPRSRQSLGLLAKWAMRFSPSVAVDPSPMGEVFPSPNGLLLNVTGTAHLFGGEPLFLTEVATRLYRLGFTARASIAPTIGVAWALSRFGPAALASVTEERMAAAVEPLPISALRIPAATCMGLWEVGIERIGQLLRLPREGVMVRFGEEVLLRLDQALGRVDERITAIQPVEPIVLRRVFEGATTQLEAVLVTVRELLEELAALLLARESGVRGLRMELNRMSDPPAFREITLGRPSRDAKHLWSLVRPKIEGMNLGYGVEAVVVTATWVAGIQHRQTEAWTKEGGEGADDQALEALLDTLVNRWGTKRVLAAVPAASHVPEAAYRLVPAREAEAYRKASPAPVPWLDRPSQLFERAEPAEAVALQPDRPPSFLRWRGEGSSVIEGMGPERIVVTALQSERTRDYFKIQLEGGRWLWVYREWETGSWFVHGMWA
jgi:protein ImuB